MTERLQRSFFKLSSENICPEVARSLAKRDEEGRRSFSNFLSNQQQPFGFRDRRLSRADGHGWRVEYPCLAKERIGKTCSPLAITCKS